MSETNQTSGQPACAFKMSDEKPCGRPIYRAPEGIDLVPSCLMHSRDPKKNAEEFSKEIAQICDVSSSYIRSKEVLDFSQFVFPAYSFGFNQTFDVQMVFRDATFLSRIAFPRARFKQSVIFTGARFEESADFVGAWSAGGLWFDQVQFNGEANFRRIECIGEARFLGSVFRGEAVFINANFSKGVSFSGAIFAGEANFNDARLSHEVDFMRTIFKQDVDFSSTTFASHVEVAAESVGMQAAPTIVDFSGARFENPSRAKFSEVNKKSEKGFRVRFIDCNIEDVQFVDVNWYRWRGRRVLQDEIDIIEPIKKEENEYQKFAKQALAGC